jgi:hypothetical protein
MSPGAAVLIGTARMSVPEGGPSEPHLRGQAHEWARPFRPVLQDDCRVVARRSSTFGTRVDSPREVDWCALVIAGPEDRTRQGELSRPWRLGVGVTPSIKQRPSRHVAYVCVDRRQEPRPLMKIASLRRRNSPFTGDAQVEAEPQVRCRRAHQVD